MIQQRRHLKVFLCHASGDKPRVRELYRYLRRRRIRPWFDEEDLVGGQDWREEISKAVREADVVVICLSNQSVTKEGYVQREMKFALDVAEEKPEGSVFIIPARLDECVVPERLRRWQWVDLFSEGGYQKLTKSLQARAQGINESPINASSVRIMDPTTRPRDDETLPPGRPRPEPPGPIDEPEKPPVPFPIKLIFTVAMLLVLVYLNYTYFFEPKHQTLLICTQPTISATGISIALWFLVSLGWYYLEEPVKNLIDTIPPAQQDFKILLTKITVRVTDLFFLGQLSKSILIFFATAAAFGTIVIWVLNWNGIPIFSFSSEETPRILGFSVISSSGTQTLGPEGTVELERGQQFLVRANHLSNNVVCKWSSGSRTTLPSEPECATRYSIPPAAEKIDTLTVQIQSACKTKSVFASLNVKVLEP